MVCSSGQNSGDLKIESDDKFKITCDEYPGHMNTMLSPNRYKRVEAVISFAVRTSELKLETKDVPIVVLDE